MIGPVWQTMVLSKNSGTGKLLLQFIAREFRGRDAAARGFVQKLHAPKAAHLRGLPRRQFAEFKVFQREQEFTAFAQGGGVLACRSSVAGKSMSSVAAMAAKL